MDIDIRFDEGKKVLFVTSRGPLNAEAFTEAMVEITHSDRYPPDTDALWDLREVLFEDIDAMFWRTIIEIRERFPERSSARLAHVVQGDFAFGMLRMYEILSGLNMERQPQTLRVFKSIPDAERWLLDSRAGDRR